MKVGFFGSVFLGVFVGVSSLCYPVNMSHPHKETALLFSWTPSQHIGCNSLLCFHSLVSNWWRAPLAFIRYDFGHPVWWRSKPRGSLPHWSSKTSWLRSVPPTIPWLIQTRSAFTFLIFRFLLHVRSFTFLTFEFPPCMLQKQLTQWQKTHMEKYRNKLLILRISEICMCRSKENTFILSNLLWSWEQAHCPWSTGTTILISHYCHAAGKQ